MPISGKKRTLSQMKETDTTQEASRLILANTSIFDVDIAVSIISSYLPLNDIQSLSRVSVGIARNIKNDNLLASQQFLTLIKEYESINLNLTESFWRGVLAKAPHLKCSRRLDGRACVNSGCTSIDALPTRIMWRHKLFNPSAREQGMLWVHDPRWESIQSLFSDTSVVHHGRILSSYNTSYFSPELHLYRECDRIMDTYPLSNTELRTFPVYQIDPSAINCITKMEQEQYGFYKKLSSGKGYIAFLDSFNNAYCFNLWKRYIDWKRFIIAGGSVVSHICDEISLSESSDVDLFCVGIKHKHFFMRKVMDFASKLLIKGIHVSIHQAGEDVYTVQLKVVKAEFKVSVIKIQFIWSCSYATTESVLGSFDINCTQVAFLPYIEDIVYTYSFAQFINTGIGRSYGINTQNPTEKQVYRILKYTKRGIKYWWFDLRDSVELLCAWIRHVDQEITDDDAFGTINVTVSRNHHYKAIGYVSKYKIMNDNLIYQPRLNPRIKFIYHMNFMDILNE